MKKGVYNVIKGVVVSTSALLLILFNPAKGTATSEAQKAPAVKEKEENTSWKEYRSVEGKCAMKFPTTPQHVAESMHVSEEGYDLKYDAYISSLDKKNIFMLLIAQYPTFINETYARSNLESFLNGILSHNPGNQLIFADLLYVNGHEALDFFVRTGSVYFRGRAVMVKNSLYLMAMECDVQAYDESRYSFFVDSFKFIQ